MASQAMHRRQQQEIRTSDLIPFIIVIVAVALLFCGQRQPLSSLFINNSNSNTVIMAAHSWKQAAAFAVFSALSILSAVDGFVTPSSLAVQQPLRMADVAVDEKVNGLAYDSDKLR